MIKKILLFLTLLTLSAVGFLYWSYSSKRTIITPYTYSFNANAKLAINSEINEAESAKILITGDQMAATLNNYTADISAELSQNFKTPLKIYNWSKPHEGLHRTLFKLKSLKKFPSVIIYHGASSELYEKIFSVSDKKSILKNFSTYDDEKIISLIITFPILSKIFYKKVDYYDLGAIKEYQNHLSGQEKMDEKEISFKLFDYELRELIELVKNKKSNLILITTPLNLEIHPKEICSQSTSQTIIEVQQQIEADLKAGNFKKAYTDSLLLSKETISNAKSFYLLGIASLKTGDLQLAREALQKATVFDCANWRGNAVYNSILKYQAKTHQIPVIDFDQYMSSALSKDGLFIDEIYPQNIFYQTLESELKETLKKILSVNN